MNKNVKSDVNKQTGTRHHKRKVTRKKDNNKRTDLTLLNFLDLIKFFFFFQFFNFF